MAKLPDPRIEICAKARLIETRAHAIAGFARRLSETPDPTSVEPEEWASYSQSLEVLLKELADDVEIVVSKAQHAI
ncbi:hypothetical protein A3753_19725 [Sulfitobacter sp. HI0082]|uniref:hypothetical protein n=1 Tax=unclassified Sulfitobacter TaxID=196795 RepID=UPI0007CFD37C|nr:hypothetical protein A3753_19725 [Sulfitobacter sp. HI0082]|tara:strand:+ start:151 stop:378 length:228 start_codon:yes stop_codon:yes gene_type:complete